MSTSKLVATVCLLGATFGQAFAQPDYTIYFFTPDSSDYFLTDTGISDPSIYAGLFPAADPTLNLVVGKRYRITVEDPLFHPLVISAADPLDNPIEDKPLLSQSAAASIGAFNEDPAVNFTDDGLDTNGSVEFTLTTDLYNAMFDTTGGIDRVPGYKCDNHGAMRGLLNITLPDTPTMTQTPTQTSTLTMTPSITTTPTLTLSPTVIPTTTIPTTATPTSSPTPGPYSLILASILNGSASPALDRNEDFLVDSADVQFVLHGHHHGHR